MVQKLHHESLSSLTAHSTVSSFLMEELREPKQHIPAVTARQGQEKRPEGADPGPARSTSTFPCLEQAGAAPSRKPSPAHVLQPHFLPS